MTIQRSPKGSGPAGRRLWRAVTSEFEFDEHELALLTALVRQVDRLDKLEELVEAEGLTVTGHGTVKPGCRSVWYRPRCERRQPG